MSRPSSAKPELVAQTLELAPPLEGAIVPLKPVVEPGLKEFKAPDVPVVRESEDVVVIETAQEPHQTGLVEDIARPVLSGHLETDVPPRGVRLELEKGAMRYASEDDIREFASNISRVKGRQRIVLETVMQHGVEEGGKMLNLQPSSVLGYLGMVSRVMGIPKPNRFHPYDRMNAMRRAWEYRKVNPEACGDPEKVVLQRGEWQLLESFRVMSLSDRAQLLRIAEIFASKTK